MPPLQCPAGPNVCRWTQLYSNGRGGVCYEVEYEVEMCDSKAKKRMLPVWMIGAGTDGKEDHAKKVKRRKKQAIESPMKQTVYCMNEEELVEAALEVLSRSYKQNNADENNVKVKGDQGSPSASLEASLMSEDITVGDSPSSLLHTFLPRSGSQDPLEEDDDPLKYVREIFFN
ncbi:cell cycle regulator of non-homologous end joining [Ambystoma mexicanum]|uniref:cell cycle regulator of non-homologous end joining n=1 Tax=Ambystoma mexicanum TaxID=8296 RepID=UPI0037E8A608